MPTVSEMLVIADTLDEIAAKHERLVGFYGSPPREVLIDAAALHGAPLLDLDIDFGAPAANLVSKAYCHIIRNCVDNALALRSRLVCVVAATGREKCDAGRFAAWMLRDVLGIEVLFTENHALPPPLPPALLLTKKSELETQRSVTETWKKFVLAKKTNGVC